MYHQASVAAATAPSPLRQIAGLNNASGSDCRAFTFAAAAPPTPRSRRRL
ncbi:MAG: hypothetical protein ACLU38_01350 [Dysosmobacter sp.]